MVVSDLSATGMAITVGSPQPRAVLLRWNLGGFLWHVYALIAGFMWPIWGPPGADRTQVGPMLAPWTLLSGWLFPRIYHMKLWMKLLQRNLDFPTNHRINPQWKLRKTGRTVYSRWWCSQPDSNSQAHAGILHVWCRYVRIIQTS